MNYAFQVVPAAELARYHKLLSVMEAPVDRYQALKLGACSVLVASLARQCVDGIAEEKRHLAAWVRNQRSVVRVMRFKGASKYRGAFNANISNASDRARNQLDALRSFAPVARSQAEQQFEMAARFVSLDEATAYIPTFKDEDRKKRSVQQTRSFAIVCLTLGIISLFKLPQIGLIFLVIAVSIWMVKRQEWQALKEAEQAREQQISEIRERQEITAQFSVELDSNPVPEVDETIKLSIDAISMDLEKKYVFLDVACRDLSSQALSWDALAAEVLDSMKDPEMQAAMPQMKPPSPPPWELNNNSQSKQKSTEFSLIEADATSASIADSDNAFAFRLSLEEIHQIMRQLGYKRFPRELDGLSARAEELIGRFLAKRAGAAYEEYLWTYESGEFKAVSLS